MSRVRPSVLLVAALLVASWAPSLADEAPGSLSGKVLGNSEPLSTVVVYAYQTADLKMDRTITSIDGRFSFSQLPAGLYKIVAFKPGFLPAVVMLNRATQELQQYVQLELSQRNLEASNDEQEDFWSVRERIPGDVLRDLAATPAEELLASATMDAEPVRFRGEMQASAGMHENSELGNSQVSGGQVSLQREFQKMQVGFWGDFSHLTNGDNPSINGEARTVALDVQKSDRTRVYVSSLDNSLHNASQPVDLESHRVSWSQGIGETGQSSFAAAYLEESNFYRRGAILPGATPLSSRTWSVEGEYSGALGMRSSLETGFRYQARESFGARDYLGGDLPLDRVDLYGNGGYAPTPTVLVGYGLYSTLQDGSLSLAPRGEVMLQMGPHWTASSAASYRVYEDERDLASQQNFFSYLHGERGDCENLEAYCYQVSLARNWGEDHELSLGAVHRKYGETMRLYFTEDFFDQPESIYLVPGDELPEVKFNYRRRVTEGIHASLQSSLAAGGGGIVQSTRRRAYENEIRYMVTSLDTLFERTSTGVYVAFHHLEQVLNPLTKRATLYAPEMERERLQLQLTQELDLLRDLLAADLAVRLNMEVSRGGQMADDEDSQDELLKRFMTGVALKF